MGSGASREARMNPLRATAGLAATRGAEPLAGMYSEVAIALNQIAD